MCSLKAAQIYKWPFRAPKSMSAACNPHITFLPDGKMNLALTDGNSAKQTNQILIKIF